MNGFESLRGLTASIVGAAREGIALAGFLARVGARVTLSDSKPVEAFEGRLDDLAAMGVRLALGGSPPDLLDCDVLFLSPGVPPYADIVSEARERGVPISSEPRLTTQLCPAPVVGISGSSGKTTTTALTGEMLSAAGLNTWVGGNIGRPLIRELLGGVAPDAVVLELSSFQLELFTPAYQGDGTEASRSDASRAISVEGWSPHVAAITNITPNHLDRHPSMEDYIAAKRTLLTFQTEGDWAILNWDDEITRAMAADTPAQVLWFSLRDPVEAGGYLDGQHLVLCHDGGKGVLCCASDIKLRGRHNLANVLTASCCALAAGAPIEAIRQAATTFTGVAHRLEPVRTWRGIQFVNDSIATSPERAIAALRSFDEPIVLLAGGRDKHLPWEDWADLALDRAVAVVAFGEAAPIVQRALAGARGRRGAEMAGLALHQVETLDEAVSLAAEVARSGQVVLLSPGGTSFDAYVDFEARGRHYRELVRAL